MRVVLFLVGAALIVFGAVWVLQGTNILAGTPMSGHHRWILAGGVSLVLGIILEVFGLRIKKR